MDNSPESNPRYPHNNADPARIAHKLKFSNIEQIKTQIELVQTLSGQLMDAVNKLSWMQFSIDVEHHHDQHKKDE